MDLAHAVVAQHLAAHATDRQYTASADELAEAERRAIARAERVAARVAARRALPAAPAAARPLTERGRHAAPPRPARA